MRERNTSHGHHGGNRNEWDEEKDKNPTKADARNTDVESLAAGRNVAKAGGHERGR